MNKIIFLEPIFKDYIWGGTRLKEELNKKTKYKRTAESWEISSNSNGNCRILNKEFKNKTLKDLFEENTLKREIFGNKCIYMNEFPLLIKYIDAKDDLSIQVHPDDNYARQKGLLNGKNEMWYIMDSSSDSKIIAGLKEKINKSELEKIINKDEIKNYINYIKVRKGDSIYIPAGTIHAILKNNLICEIQQNCDTTYRVYDWDRKEKNGKGRELHKKEAIETINFKNIPEIIHTENRKIYQKIVKNKYFEVYKINCINTFEDCSNDESFYAMNVVNGTGYIKTEKETIKLMKGDSFIIPSKLGKYVINGKIEILKSYIV